MGITDLFSTSLLIGIAIIVILLGLFFAYFSYKLVEQEHKINSIVRTMAEELMFFRKQLTMIYSNHLPPFPTFDDSKTVTIGFGGGVEEREKEITDELICVSDDEEDEDDDEDDDEDEEDGEDDDEQDDGDDYTDTDGEEEEEEEEEEEHTINIDDNGSNGQIIFLNLIDTHEPTNNIKTVHIQEIFEMGEEKGEDKEIIMEEGEELVFDGHNDLSEHIDNIHPFTTKPDYKKMSVTKLREIVVEKNLVHDASKLKKGELLKLLGDV